MISFADLAAHSSAHEETTAIHNVDIDEPSRFQSNMEDAFYKPALESSSLSPSLSQQQPLSAPYTTHPLSMAGRSIPMPNPSPAAQQFIQHRNRVHHQSQQQQQHQHDHQNHQHDPHQQPEHSHQAPVAAANEITAYTNTNPSAPPTPRASAVKRARKTHHDDEPWTPIPPPTPSGRRTPTATPRQRHSHTADAQSQSQSLSPDHALASTHQSIGGGGANTSPEQVKHNLQNVSPPAAARLAPPPPNPKNLSLFHALPAHFDLFRTPLGYSSAVHITADAGLPFYGECVADALGRSEARPAELACVCAVVARETAIDQVSSAMMAPSKQNIKNILIIIFDNISDRASEMFSTLLQICDRH